jgi:hypothetical protein
MLFSRRSKRRKLQYSKNIGNNIGRCRLQDPTEVQCVELVEACCKISKALDAWYASLGDFMLDDSLQELLTEDVWPEKELLWIPSDFAPGSHHWLGLEELAAVERQLRVGQVHDALKKLCTMLGLKSFLVKCKYKLAG